MSERPAPADARSRFSERLGVPWWWWPIGVGLAALLAAEVHLGYPGVRAWLPYLLAVPLALVTTAWLGRHRVEIAEGELRVGPAHLPLRYVGRVRPVTARDKRAALGPELDPAAYVLHRPWIKTALRVELTDPDDPTPYWLFSVRRADELADQLRAFSGGEKANGRPPAGGRPS